MRILLTATSLLPAYGGPARSVSGLAQHLTDQGVEVILWANDGSASTTPFLPKDTSVVRVTGPLKQVVHEKGQIDVIHDNGIWLPHNHQIAKLSRQLDVPRIVSLRGMLEPWARNHKWLKKRIAWLLYQRRDLMQASWHHATSSTEEQNLKEQCLGVPVAVIPNGLDIPDVGSDGIVAQGSRNRRTALFVGRIYPVKGLPMLIDAWAKVRPNGWNLRLVGPDEAGHRAHLERRVRDHGLTDEIVFEGPLDGVLKEKAYREADLFILPSHTENFGLAIGEALAYGLPVLTTKGTPWSSLIEHKCGWWVEAKSTAIADALHAATSLEVAERQQMGARGRTMVREMFSWKYVAAGFATLYAQAREKHSQSTENSQHAIQLT